MAIIDTSPEVLAKLLYPGVQAVIASELEKLVEKETAKLRAKHEELVRAAIFEACQVVICSIVGVRSFADHSISIQLCINLEDPVTIKAGSK